jgi:two-component system cell cycle sensor histidine kinase/response regulator CckA
LLVEDEDPVRSFASRALRLRGYEVCEAASAEEAMEMIDDPAIRIDLLVSDVVMPGTDGPTLAAHARRKRPGLRVVFISGYAEDSFRRNLVEHDFLFLAKPFSLVELTAKVKEAISGSDASPDG